MGINKTHLCSLGDSITYVFEFPLLVSLPEKEVDILSLSKANAHDASGNRLWIIANTAFLGEFIGNLAITEAFLTHLHHELVVGVQLMGDTPVVGWQAITLMAIATAKGTRGTRRRFMKGIVLFIQDKGLGVVELRADGGPLERNRGRLGEGNMSTLALTAGCGVLMLGSVAFCIILVFVV